MSQQPPVKKRVYTRRLKAVTQAHQTTKSKSSKQNYTSLSNTSESLSQKTNDFAQKQTAEQVYQNLPSEQQEQLNLLPQNQREAVLRAIAESQNENQTPPTDGGNPSSEKELDVFGGPRYRRLYDDLLTTWASSLLPIYLPASGVVKKDLEVLLNHGETLCTRLVQASRQFHWLYKVLTKVSKASVILALGSEVLMIITEIAGNHGANIAFPSTGKAA